MCARTLLRERPELGTLKRQHIAAWVGVAPLHGASGTLRGRRIIWGGRAPVRTVLSMGTLVATRYHPLDQSLLRTAPRGGEGQKSGLDSLYA